MVKLQYVLLAEGVVRDATSNKMSVFNITENFVPAAYPVFFPRLAVLAAFHRQPTDPSTLPVEVRLMHKGKSLGTRSAVLDFQKSLGTRLMVDAQGFILPEPGEFGVEVHMNGKLVGGYTAMAEPVPTLAKADASVAPSTEPRGYDGISKKAVRKHGKAAKAGRRPKG